MNATGSYPMPIGRYIEEAWNLFADHPMEYIGMGALIWLACLVPYGGLILASPLAGGVILFTLKDLRGESVEFGDVFKGFDRFFDLVIGGLLIGLFAGVAFMFCFLPGLIVWALYFFALSIVIDEQQGFWQAMEASRVRVLENFWGILALAVIAWVLNLAGALFCCVGTIATFPFVIVLQTIAYRDIFNRP